MIEMIKFTQPVEFEEFSAIGYYPYKTAFISGSVQLPRTLFSHIEKKLPRTDNKWVVVFKAENSSFAIFFKDNYCKLDKLSEIKFIYGKKV